MRAFGAGRDQSFTSRSGAFPALSLATQAQRAQQGQGQLAVAAGQQQQQQQPAAAAALQSVGQAAVGRPQPAAGASGGQPQRQLGQLEEAVVSGLEQLVHQVGLEGRAGHL